MIPRFRLPLALRAVACIVLAGCGRGGELDAQVVGRGGMNGGGASGAGATSGKGGAAGTAGTAGAGGHAGGAGGEAGAGGAGATAGTGGASGAAGGSGHAGASGAAGAPSKLAFAAPDIVEIGVRQAHCIVPVVWSKDGRVDVFTAHDWTPTFASSPEPKGYYDLWRIVDGKLAITKGPVSLEPSPGVQVQIGTCATTDLDHDGVAEVTTLIGHHWIRAELPLGTVSFSGTVLDLDADGSWEAVTFSADGKTLTGSLIESKDGGTWSAANEAYAVTLPFAFGALLTGDFDGDSREDLLIHDVTKSGQLQLLRGGPGGPQVLPATTVLDDFYSASVADMNGDGRADLVGRGKKGYQVALSDGKGGFAPQVLFANAAVEGEAPVDGFAVGDVSGDGRPDVVIDSPAGVYVLESDGPGTWRPVRLAVDWKHWDQNTLGQLHMIRIVDMDGDGKNDLVARRDFSLVAIRNITPSP